MTENKWVLYISQDKQNSEVFCPGSRECLKAINGNEAYVNIQNVDAMLERGIELPPWLNGTPILVDVESKRALKGSDAVKGIVEIITNMNAPNQDSADIEVDEGPQGILPEGERYLHEETPNQEIINDRPQQTREGKITEEDLQAYMAQRNASMPTQSS